MGDLSAHFSRHEFECRCGCGLCSPHPALIEALEELRAVVAAPIIVKSGTRCRKHNKSVGGAKNSMHLVIADGYSRAADIRCNNPGVTAKHIYHAATQIKAFHDGGIGLYKYDDCTYFLHVDVRGVPARWAKVDNVVVPMILALADLEREEDGNNAT